MSLRAGITEDEFYEMSPAELNRAMEVFAEMEKDRAQGDAVLVHKLGALVGVSVASHFVRRVRYPAIEQVFPGVFDIKELKAQEERKKIENFKAFAENWNARFRAKQELIEHERNLISQNPG